MLAYNLLVLLVLKECQGGRVTLRQEDEEDQLLSRMVLELLVNQLQDCSLVLSLGEGEDSTRMSGLLTERNGGYHTTVTLGAGKDNAFRPRPWNEYIGITGPEQMHSFTTMPPDMMSQVNLGDKCVLHLLVSHTPSTLHDQLVQLAGTVRVINLDDHFVLHFRNMTDQTNKDLLLDHPAKGIRYKIISNRINQSQKQLRVETVCFYCDHGHPNWMTLGSYPDKFIVHDMYPDTSRDLHGRTIKFVHFEYGDTEASRKKLKIFGRLSVTWLQKGLLAWEDTFNGRMKIISPDDPTLGNWDKIRPNGSWTGTVGDIISGTADSGMVYIMSDQVVRYVIFSPAVYNAYMTFVTALPRKVISWSLLFDPFDPPLWALILVAWIISGVALWMIIRRSGVKISLGSATASLFKMLIGQPHDLPQLTASREFEGAMRLMAIIVSCGYVTKLLAFLAVLSKEELPKTLGQLAQEGYETLIPYSNLIVVSQVDANTPHEGFINQSSIIANAEDCMVHVVDTPRKACLLYNYFVDRDEGKMRDDNGNPTLQLAPEHAYVVYSAVVFGKGIVEIPRTLMCLTKLDESGLYDQWKREDTFSAFWTNLQNIRLTKVVTKADHVEDAVKADNLIVVFALWVTGIFLASLLFTFEIVYWKSKDMFSHNIGNKSDEEVTIQITAPVTEFELQEVRCSPQTVLPQCDY